MGAVERALQVSAMFREAEATAQKHDNPTVLIVMDLDGTQVAIHNTTPAEAVMLAESFSVLTVFNQYEPIEEDAE